MSSYLWRLHIEDLCNSSLHDEEMWVVDIKLYRSKQILDPGVVGITSIDQVFVSSSYYHLLKNKNTHTHEWISIFFSDFINFIYRQNK